MFNVTTKYHNPSINPICCYSCIYPSSIPLFSCHNFFNKRLLICGTFQIPKIPLHAFRAIQIFTYLHTGYTYIYTNVYMNNNWNHRCLYTCMYDAVQKQTYYGFTYNTCTDKILIRKWVVYHRRILFLCHLYDDFSMATERERDFPHVAGFPMKWF